jgi:hypothetical protein
MSRPREEQPRADVEKIAALEAECEIAPILEHVRELDGFRGNAALFRYGQRYFVISSVSAYSGPETLVFRSNCKGVVTDWTDIAGGRRMSREQAYEDLSAKLEAGL